jgi:LysR family transcriptional regulator, transcriptional activator of the cysJI operon
MKGSHLSIEYLKIFSDLADLKSFRQTAAKNFITQSAVSQQLAALEKIFGKKLVERAHGGFALTTEGEFLLQGARAILQTYQATLDRMKNPKNKLIGTVKLQAVYSVGLYTLPHLIRDFMERFPTVNVEVEYNRSDRIENNVIAGRCDIGVVVHPCRRYKGLISTLMTKEKMVFVCNPKHSKAAERTVAPKELAQEKFVAFERHLQTWRVIDDYFRKHNTIVHVAREFDNIETLKSAIEIGAGVSILPESAVVQEMAAKSLIGIPLSGFPLYRHIEILQKQGKTLSRPSETLKNWLLSHAKKS